MFLKCQGSKVRCVPTVTLAGALIGRDSELALLAGLVTEVAAGRGSSVLIEGEPGIGKSALVRAALSEAARLGCQVFWGTGDELGQALLPRLLTAQRELACVGPAVRGRRLPRCVRVVCTGLGNLVSPL